MANFNNSSAIRALKKRESSRRSSALSNTHPAQTPLSSLAHHGGPGVPAAQGQESRRQTKLGSNGAGDTVPESSARGGLAQDQQDIEDDWRPDMDDHDDDEAQANAIAPGQSAFETSGEVLRRIKRQRAEQNKENVGHPLQDGRAKPRHFTSQQTDAQRVSPISSNDEDESGRGNGRATEPSENEEEEDEDEDAYQEDDRPVNVAARRVQAPLPGRSVPTSRDNPNRTNSSAPSLQQSFRRPNANERPSQSSRPARDEAPRQQTSTAQSSARAGRSRQEDRPRHEHEEVNELAKRRVAHQPRAVQQRRPWTPEATQRLIDYIQDDDYRTSWSRIDKAEDPLLEGRGQVGLKDKARNIKFDYLKTNMVLPVNFDRIPLSRLQIDKLRDLGIDYED